MFDNDWPFWYSSETFSRRKTVAGTLIIRLKGLGDIVHLVPMLRYLRQSNPDEQIGILCQKPFAQIIPHDLNIITFELPAHAGVADSFRLIKEIRRHRFDKLFDLFCNPRTAVISLLSGIRQRYGFDYRIRRHAYSQTFTPPNSNKHLMYLFAEFFAHFGVSADIAPPDLKFDENVRERALAAIPQSTRSARPLLAINPHTTYPSKAWPREYFVEFIKLWYRQTQQPVLVTWGPGERDAAAQIVEEAGAQAAFSHDPVRIDEFACLLANVSLFLTADTGPMNIAWAVNTPTVALFGPTTREAVAPRGEQHLTLFNERVECLQCHQETCSHKTCMYSMKPQWVLQQLNVKYPGLVKGKSL